MLIIADSSALITLATCNCLELLEKVFEEIKVPQAVFDEITIKGKSQSELLYDYLKEKIVTVNLQEFIIDTGNLGKGELEAMALYKRLSANFLLIDDLRARKIARLNDINIIGSLGVLLFGKEKGLIDRIKPILDKLRTSELFISESLLRQIQKLANE